MEVVRGRCRAGLEESQFGGGTGGGKNFGMAVATIRHPNSQTLEQRWRRKAGERGREIWEPEQIDVRAWGRETPGLTSGLPLCCYPSWNRRKPGETVCVSGLWKDQMEGPSSIQQGEFIYRNRPVSGSRATSCPDFCNGS